MEKKVEEEIHKEDLQLENKESGKFGGGFESRRPTLRLQRRHHHCMAVMADG